MTFAIRPDAGVLSVTKTAYVPPRLGQYEPAFFSAPIWVEEEMDSFRNLRPFYLVCRTARFSVSAVNFKLEGDQGYRGWQAVSVVADDDSFPPHTKVHKWFLLGFVPVGVRFNLQLRCLDAQGRIGLARCYNLIALGVRSFELAQI